MSDVLLSESLAKIRIPNISIVNNPAQRRLEWEIVAVPQSSGGLYGQPLARVLIVENVDADFASIVSPADTSVEVAPGLSIDISGISALTIQAWLQWRGEILCASAKPELHNMIFGSNE